MGGLLAHRLYFLLIGFYLLFDFHKVSSLLKQILPNKWENSVTELTKRINYIDYSTGITEWNSISITKGSSKSYTATENCFVSLTFRVNSGSSYGNIYINDKPYSYYSVVNVNRTLLTAFLTKNDVLKILPNDIGTGLSNLDVVDMYKFSLKS